MSELFAEPMKATRGRIRLKPGTRFQRSPVERAEADAAWREAHGIAKPLSPGWWARPDYRPDHGDDLFNEDSYSGGVLVFSDGYQHTQWEFDTWEEALYAYRHCRATDE
jgi:hypothetical protein